MLLITKNQKNISIIYMKFYYQILFFLILFLINHQAFAFHPAILRRINFASADSLNKEKAEAKLKAHNEARKRLRMKIKHMEAIRGGRKAYSRWIENMKTNIEKKKEKKIESEFFSTYFWLLKLCGTYWGLLP